MSTSPMVFLEPLESLQGLHVCLILQPAGLLGANECVDIREWDIHSFDLHR